VRHCHTHSDLQCKLTRSPGQERYGRTHAPTRRSLRSLRGVACVLPDARGREQCASRGNLREQGARAGYCESRENLREQARAGREQGDFPQSFFWPSREFTGIWELGKDLRACSDR
jgi:hypothetical protein